MPQIIVEDLVKTFQVAVRAPGVWGALRSLARRRYRTVRALDGVSFAIERGELVGYIGPNGAGKSTTVKVLSGIVVPDAGRCEVAGRVPWKQRIAATPIRSVRLPTSAGSRRSPARCSLRCACRSGGSACATTARRAADQPGCASPAGPRR
jgi:energy-coupling factor transporter ATP-binding protein EcfA2